MGIDLIVQNDLSSTVQIVQDQDQNNSSLALGAAAGITGGESGFVGIVGPGGLGAKATLYMSTFPAGISQLSPNVEITATDQGLFSASLSFGLQPSGSGNSPVVTVLTLFPSGGVQMPNLPNLPSSGTVDLVVDSSGNVTTQGSSVRFKEDLQPLQDDFHKVLLLDPKSFLYKETGVRGIGYTAEQVDQVGLTDLVAYGAEGEPMGVQYKMLPVYLLELLKEQQSALAEIRAEIAEMKGSAH